MSDHWNSLADMLGTPSIDPLQRKASPPAKREKPRGRAKSDDSSVPAPEVEETSKEAVRVTEELSSPVPNPVKAEQPSRLRSSWDTVARLFGVGSGPEPAPVSETAAQTTAAPTPTIEWDLKPKQDEDIFAGFGKKPDRNRAEEPPRKQADQEQVGRGRLDREPAAREPAERQPSSRDSTRDEQPRREPSTRSKKPSSFWSTSEPDVDEPVVPRSPAMKSDIIEPLDRSESEDESNDSPDRRGRTRNIRRGRNSNESTTEIPRESSDTAEPAPGRDRGRNESRNEGPRRGERVERSTEAAGSERSERSPDRPRQERPVGDRVKQARPSSDRPSSDRPSSDRPSSDRPRQDRPAAERSRQERPDAERASQDRPAQERAPSDRQPRGTDRPARDGERRPRNEVRAPRTGDRPIRGEKRAVESDDVPSARNNDRPARSEQPVASKDNRDRTSRGRGSRREPEPILEEEGEWDSSEVVFEQGEEEGVDSEVSLDGNDEDAATAAPRRRRRRRSGRVTSRTETEVQEEPNLDDEAGPQAYGRHASDEDDDDEVEDVRIHKVTSWLDAISPMIESNMENHKRNPSQDRGRSGPRGGGGNSRRRGSGSSGNR